MTGQPEPRAVLWDMDGTLIDSAEYHWLTWRDTLAELGHTLTHEQFASWFGQRNDAILRRYFGDGIAAGEVTRLGDAKPGPVALWVGNNSRGDFANLTIRRATPSTRPAQGDGAKRTRHGA